MELIIIKFSPTSCYFTPVRSKYITVFSDTPNLLMLVFWVVAYMGEVRNTYKLLVGKPEERRPVRRPLHR
jgi:hypothetical protein